MKYDRRKFATYPVEAMTLTANIEAGDVIVMIGDKMLWVDDVDLEFINDEVAALYPDNTPIKPEHTKVTIYYDNGDKCINDIPGTELLMVYELEIKKP